MLRPLLGVCASLAVLLGCGGNVVFVAEKSGAGGAGGAGSTATNGIVSTTSNVGTTGSGGSIADDCTTICNALATQGCGQVGCVANCVNNYQNTACQAQYTAVLDCIAADPQFTSCEVSPNACSAQVQAYTDCTSMSGTSDAVSGSAASSGSGGGGCVESCTASNSGCDCTGQCSGGGYEVNCGIANSGVMCTCVFNGAMQTCSSPSLTCDFGSSCCAAIFPPN